MQYIRFPNQTIILSGQVDSWTFDGVGNAITSTALPGSIRALDVNLAGGSVNVGGVGDVGDPVVAQALQAGFQDPSGNIALGHVNVSGDLLVQVTASALPTGAATEATLSAMSAKLPATLGQKAMAASFAVAIASDQSAIPVTAAALPLPTGAATEATLAALNAKIANNYGAASGAVRTASQVGNASGVADFGAGNSSAQTLRTVIVTDQSPIPTTSGTNTAGNIVNASLTGTSASSASAPANAVGFILEAESTNTNDIRWCVGGTASTTVGMRAEPGRDSGYVPLANTISICATVSGTNAYSIQWVMSS